MEALLIQFLAKPLATFSTTAQRIILTLPHVRVGSNFRKPSNFKETELGKSKRPLAASSSKARNGRGKSDIHFYK